MTPDHASIARAALSASTQTSGEIAVFYLASARLSYAMALEEMKNLERGIISRERELARAAAPKQLASGDKP